MLGRVEPHSHDLLGRRILPSTPGEILADGVSARAKAISNRHKPGHEIPAAWRMRKLATRKISIDLECRDTIELLRQSEGLDTLLSSCKSDEACHRSYLDGEPGVVPIAAGADMLRRKQAGDPSTGAARARGSRGSKTGG